MEHGTQIPLDKLKYPIGRFENPTVISQESLDGFINEIETFPSRLRHEVGQMSNAVLDTRYRPHGWTIRQVVNHCADSHMNALMRFKLALTENKPVIKPYLEALWAELPDSREMPIAPALQMLDGIHERWVKLLKSMHAPDFDKSFIHPERGSEITLRQMTALYAWHCNHHLAHVRSVVKP